LSQLQKLRRVYHTSIPSTATMASPTASLDAPPKQPSNFAASWTPSKANALAVPLGKAPRAWDRKATQTKTETGKTKTVWKRYTLRSGDASTAVNKDMPVSEGQGEIVAAKSPGRIVKKSRVLSPVKGGNVVNKGRRKSSATKYERRKSGLKRKSCVCAVTRNRTNAGV
jgi:hypothetical protein